MAKFPSFILLVILAWMDFAIQPCVPILAQDRIANSESRTRLSKVMAGEAPSGTNDLLAMQSRIRELSDRLVECTVAIQVGRANGSGVIITETGYVLTAAHVAGTPNQRAIIYLADGREVYGKTLGMNEILDAGLIKIETQGKWPHAKLGQSSKTKLGQWCLATGHPGGYDPSRKPVLRMGRVLKTEDSAILTDCTLVGGDSGGPLFDLSGRVIGIHSRIGKNLTVNVHVPVDNYRDAWDRLVKGDAWDLMNQDGISWIGVKGSNESSQGVRIGEVVSDSPAEQAGLEIGDEILAIEGNSIREFAQLRNEIRSHQPGDSVKLEVRRNGETIEFRLRIGSSTERSTRR